MEAMILARKTTLRAKRKLQRKEEKEKKKKERETKEAREVGIMCVNAA